MKKRLTPAGSTDLSLPAVMAAGAFAGVAMWSIAIPPDVSRSPSAHLTSRKVQSQLILNRTLALTGHQISITIRPERDVQRVRGLRAKDDQGGRSGRALERILGGHGEGGTSERESSRLESDAESERKDREAHGLFAMWGICRPLRLSV